MKFTINDSRFISHNNFDTIQPVFVVAFQNYFVLPSDIAMFIALSATLHVLALFMGHHWAYI
jgi:hypothetical protein